MPKPEQFFTAEVRVILLSPSGKAVLVKHNGENQWVPLSQITDVEDLAELQPGWEGEIRVPLWIAREKGWA